MFSWKKQNPPSRQRQQQIQESAGDYSDLIAHGMRLANEDIDDSGAGDEGMGDYGDEDMGDIDLDDPDLLAELHGLTGEAPVLKVKSAAGSSQPPSNTAAPQTSSIPSAMQTRPATSKPATVAASQESVVLPSKQSSTEVASSVAHLGIDLQEVMEDDDNEEVELTEDDWKDPHFLAQLQSLGGHATPHDAETPTTSFPSAEDSTKGRSATWHTPAAIQQESDASATHINKERDHTPTSSNSSMITVPPRGHNHSDKDADGDSSMIDHTREPKSGAGQSVTSPSEARPPKPLEEVPKKNDKDLLKQLQTREGQYKRAALEAKRAGDMALAGERLKTYKSLQAWIRLVEAGGFLDLELYPIPDEPPATVVDAKPNVDQIRTPPNVVSSVTPSAKSILEGSKSNSYAPPISSSASEATTQVSSSIAEASADDLRTGSTVRGGRGIEFRQLAPDDDFQIVSNTDADTYDMLESQLESQIKMCTTTSQYYYHAGDKSTALEFHKLNKIFKADLVSLQSCRTHGKKVPAFHFQDVRFEVEVGFYQEVGLNDLSLNITRAWDLSHKDVQPNDMDTYVMWDLGWPTENMTGTGLGKGNTPTIKKTQKPEFNYSKTIGIERSRAFQRFVERRKVTFDVWHYRGLLWKDYLLGRAQVPLHSLLNHSEINEIVPLVDPTTRRNTGGKIEVKIRLQRPLLKPEIAIKEEKWLVIDEFNSGGLGFPSPIAATPPSRSANSPALGRAGTPVSRTNNKAAPSASAIRAPTTPTPAALKESLKPAGPTGQPVSAGPGQPNLSPASANPSVAPIPKRKPAPVAAPSRLTAVEPEQEGNDLDRALNELNDIEMLVSNMVLEHEIQEAQRLLHDSRAVGNHETAEEYQDRLTQLEIKMKLLVLQVQTGQLTMEAYCHAVNVRIAKDKKLALELKKLGMIPEAKKALARSKIMAQEMKEVEEAMAAQAQQE
ncbi:Coiled-coil and C2 domain-containing protein 1B [Mortierella sp. GBA30]|nr:Coiled-coil and C2 domain-containing protein 1B [Mortierella sp. GBA30]